MARCQAGDHAGGVFMVSETDATAIRDIYEKDGELSAAIELRRRFPGIIDNAKRGTARARLPAGRRCPHRRPKLCDGVRAGRRDTQGHYPAFSRGRKVRAPTRPAAEPEDIADGGQDTGL